ncbi:unnamed protein product [Fraxinus pennsylvanica]|uniref:Uncharacterized protein n=1 Tax=Fraxinus pennsylvanica TaxID=56036 RepID=A0AAD2A2N9_9LAMI|nr:unnamed protein product [Fraxinus pennsylvanica]
MRNLKRNALIKGSKSKFNEYLELEMKGGTLLAKEDLKLEKKLAKKLKFKNGKLQGVDDDIDMLLEGIPSILSNLEENEKEIEKNFQNGTLHRKRKTSKLPDIVSKAEKLVDNVDEESDTLDAISDEHDDVEEVVLHKDSRKRNLKKTKFKEYPETEMQGGMLSGEADLALEEKLAKKLKVKEGRLSGENDEINMLFREIPSVLDSSGDELITSDEDPKRSLDNSYSSERLKKRKSIDQEKRAEGAVDPLFGVSKPVEPSGAGATSEQVCHVVPGKYVAPHLRSRAKKESEEYAQIRRQIRGLLNRLSEANLESITGEISTILKSVGRSVGSQIVQEEVVASCSGGPRGNEQIRVVFFTSTSWKTSAKNEFRLHNIVT